MTIANLTPYAWQVSFTAAGQPPQRTRVSKFAVLDVSVAAGDCVIEQTVIDDVGAIEPTRRFEARFEPGQGYRWSLATMRSSGVSVPAGEDDNP